MKQTSDIPQRLTQIGRYGTIPVFANTKYLHTALNHKKFYAKKNEKWFILSEDEFNKTKFDFNG